MATAVTVLRVIQVVLWVIIIVLMGVAANGKMIVKRSNSEDYVTFWEFSVNGDVKIDTADLGCARLRRGLNAAAALTVISMIFIFFGFLMGLAQLCAHDLARNKVFRIIFLAILAVAWILSLAAWTLMADFYHSSWCGSYTPKIEDYRFGYGFGLLVAMWCLQIIPPGLEVLTHSADPERHSAPPKQNSPVRVDEQGKSNASSNSPTAEPMESP